MKGKQIGTLLLVLVIIVAAVFYTFVGIGTADSGVSPLADKLKLGLDIKGGVYVVFSAETEAKGEDKRLLMNQTVEVLRRRIDSMGLTEPNIYLEGEDRIRVELPGVEDSTEALAAIGKTAKLTFAQVKDGQGAISGEHYSMEKMIPLFNGEGIKDASYGQDSRTGENIVSLQLNEEASEAFKTATSQSKTYSNPYSSKPGGQIAILLDDVVISAPSVSNTITNGRAQISGSFTIESARELATLIKSGALPVNLIEERSSVKGPTLGQGAYEMSVKAALIGIILIMLFMIIVYKLPGLMSSIALVLYSSIIVMLMVVLDATLTLPGVLGIVLSIGMAVDANVIIFEKLKEELNEGKSLKASVSHGFSKAFRAIIDSNVTTFIAAVVLFYFGEGPIKGFAVTLMLGIMTSMFTAIFVTRTLLVQLTSSKKFSDKKHYMSRFSIKKNHDFIGKKKIWFSLSTILIVVGIVTFLAFSGLNYGIDFSGGTMMQIQLDKQHETAEIQKILAPYGEFSINFEGKNMDQVVIMSKVSLDNAKRSEIFDALKTKYNLEDNALLVTEQFGPRIGSEIQGKAVKAIILAAIGMLIYIAVRFEVKYAFAAIIALIHDILILLAMYAIFRIPVNSAFIAAILTVVGYSINDTIVIFDRIREEARYSSTANNTKIANASLNSTITRSINTSFTTLLVVISLMVLSVSSIRELALPLLVGVLAGTYSSIFIASPVWVILKEKFAK